VFIMATNLIGNIDAAFMRRITYVIHFPFPDAAMREEIYRRTIPASAPLEDDIDWTFLAEKFELSGGHIKNIVLSAAFLAAQENQPIGMSQLLRSAIGELKKNEIVVVREELREYADLIN
ncbi:MAG: ATP-binding protein, partial [Clostridiales bacterium]|nr:ATP-binding protein [Clostridiales bacterium]